MFASPKRSVLRVGGPVLRVGWSPQFFRVSRIHFIVRPPTVRESYALKRYNIMYTVIARMSNDPRSFTRRHCRHVAWKRKKKTVPLYLLHDNTYVYRRNNNNNSNSRVPFGGDDLRTIFFHHHHPLRAGPRLHSRLRCFGVGEKRFP